MLQRALSKVRRLLQRRRPGTAQAVQREVRVDLVPRSRCGACGFPLPPPPAPRLPAKILECEECGTGWTWPPPERDVEGDGLWVERYGSARLQRRDQWLTEAKLRLDWLSRFEPEGVVLEIGCGTGEFVKTVADAGFEAYGVEPSEWAAAEARNLGAPVHTGYLRDWKRAHPDIRPGLIAMWHVLEHVPDPANVLADVAESLEPRGLLVLEVPNFRSSDAHHFGVEWVGAQPDDHFAQFTAEGITVLLEGSGFKLLELLPLSREVYESAEDWELERAEALAQGREWPPLDLLRACAQRTGSPA